MLSLSRSPTLPRLPNPFQFPHRHATNPPAMPHAFIIPLALRLLIHVHPSPPLAPILYRPPSHCISKMGNCCSSNSTPAAYAASAANLAESALHSLSTTFNPTTFTPPTPHPSVTQVIPHCQISRIPDGDTFTCTYTHPLTHVRTTSRVRVQGIDTPETRQAYGPDATAIAQKLLADSLVTLHVHTTDRYSRLIADVFVERTGANLAEEMLKAGAAWHYKHYDKRESYAQLEQDAKQARRGLWAAARPMPPWEYRRRYRNHNQRR